MTGLLVLIWHSISESFKVSICISLFISPHVIHFHHMLMIVIVQLFPHTIPCKLCQIVLPNTEIFDFFPFTMYLCHHIYSVLSAECSAEGGCKILTRAIYTS